MIERSLIVLRKTIYFISADRLGIGERSGCVALPGLLLAFSMAAYPEQVLDALLQSLSVGLKIKFKTRHIFPQI